MDTNFTPYRDTPVSINHVRPYWFERLKRVQRGAPEWFCIGEFSSYSGAYYASKNLRPKFPQFEFKYTKTYSTKTSKLYARFVGEASNVSG